MNDLVPEGWDIHKISDVSKVGSSKRILQSEYVADGVPFFRSKEVILRSKRETVKNILYISRERFEELKNKFSAPIAGEILVTAVGTIGVIYQVENFEFYFKDGNLLWIKDIDCKVNSEYLAKYMTSDFFQTSIERISGGSSQAALTIEKLSELEFNLPPLPEQQKIAKILTSVDEVIEKTQALIDKLKDLKTGMMQELLTNGIGNNGKPHTKFKDSPVGKIPAEWEACQMRDVCITKQGLQIPISERYSEPAKNRYVYLTIRFINTGFSPSVAEYIENPSERVVCDESDIILARTGATGKVVTGVKGVFHNNFFKVDYERGKIHKNYFVHYLNSPFIQTEIKNRAGTTTIPDLNHGDFYSMPLLLPKFKEQIKISEVLDANDNLIDINYKKLNILKSQKKALMQDLLTGKIRVKVEPTL